MFVSSRLDALVMLPNRGHLERRTASRFDCPLSNVKRTRFEAQKISERTRAGMSRARAKGIKIARPQLTAELRDETARRAVRGETAYAIGKALHIDRHTAAKYLQS
jgi:DNA invertase Pin-like site-specific DNA recombinase